MVYVVSYLYRIGGGKAYFHGDGRHIGDVSSSHPSRPVVTGLELASVTTGLELAPVTTGLELVPVVIAITGTGGGDRTEEDIEKRGKGGSRRLQQRD
ncbi:hypothetical protein F2Q70_00003200 [Brassica cretica]|uniref:Uncharacterized protein n=1 Tax=Brassica cretica TaxID=69181 RepID=A0A8S9ISS9_BRACR|nr:hypothetical protein F2Q70_00003200 [Brassica cretica]